MKISVKNLGFSYNGQPILDGIYLEVREGEILALVGPNGSGKTTLLRNIAGVLRPNVGAVYLDFKKLNEFTPHELARHLGAVEQEREVGFDFTVQELVELGRLPHQGRLKRFDRQDHKAVQRAMELTYIEKFATRPISQLSGGEQQRVFLAMVLAQEPQIVLLDEPTAHLDINYQVEILEIIREQAGIGLSVMMALHDLTLAARYADKVALLYQKNLLAVGPAEKVLTEANIKKVFHIEAMVSKNPITGFLYIDAVPSRVAKGKEE